jgi:hypothetical protein
MKNFWTDDDHLEVALVTSFEGAASIGIRILERMRQTEREIVQICGPMSTGGLGNLSANMARFQLAIVRAQSQGLLVFDQIPFQNAIIRLSGFEEGRRSYNHDILEIFYRRIFESGHVRRTLFLPGWEGSVGATWERKLVSDLGLVVVEYPEEWLL